MFTEEQRELIRSVCGHSFDFSNLSDDDWVEIEDAIGDHLTLRCLDENYNPNAEGLICEDILDSLPH